MRCLAKINYVKVYNRLPRLVFFFLYLINIADDSIENYCFSSLKNALQEAIFVSDILKIVQHVLDGCLHFTDFIFRNISTIYKFPFYTVIQTVYKLFTPNFAFIFQRFQVLIKKTRFQDVEDLNCFDSVNYSIAAMHWHSASKYSHAASICGAVCFLCAIFGLYYCI